MGSNPTTRPTSSPTTRPTSSPMTRPTSSPTTARPSSGPTKAPTSGPTILATGPTGKTIYAYPDIMDGNLLCLMDDLYPDYFLNGRNPESMLFSSLEACCEARGYPCTAEPSVTPTVAPTRNPTESPKSGPTKHPTPHPTESPTDSPTPSPTQQPRPEPTKTPTCKPTLTPIKAPTLKPTPSPTKPPTRNPSWKAMFWYPDVHALVNLCVFDKHYEDWMDTVDHRDGYLFTTERQCCIEHNCAEGAESSDSRPLDVLTYIDENFDSGSGDTKEMWIHGGTTTHIADWRFTTHKKHSGNRSFRSGSLNHKRGKSSDVSLKVDSSKGAQLSFWYYVDVARPFDFFEFRYDGVLNHVDASPSGGWMMLNLGISPGPHTISFHVVSPNEAVSIDRSENLKQFGRGFVYIDDLQFTPYS